MRRAEIERLLPGVFQLALHPLETSALEPDRRLAGALDAMESLHEPCEQILGRLETYLDPRRAPAEFVTYLAGWVDLGWLVTETQPVDTDRMRELVGTAMELSRWRGTLRGLLRFLVTATGLNGFVLDEAPDDSDGVPMPFHVRIRAPAEARRQAALVDRIVRIEKPASMTYEVTYGPP